MNLNINYSHILFLIKHLEEFSNIKLNMFEKSELLALIFDMPKETTIKDLLKE